MQQTAQPFQQTAQPYQPNMQSNGQPAPVQKGSNKKMIGMIAGIAAVVLIGLFFLLSGGGDKEEAEAVAHVADVVTPEVNLDSIAQLRILAAQDLALEAKDFQDKYAEELLDSAHGLVEKYYLDIIDQCKMYKDEADQIRADQPEAQLKDQKLSARLDELKGDAEKQLLDIYKRLEGDGKEFASMGSTDIAESYTGRAAFIKSYIEHLLSE